MNESAFRAELTRMASKNGILLSHENQLIDLLREDIDRGADFVNVFRGSNKRLLLVTTWAVRSIKTGLLSAKLDWVVRNADVRSVGASRKTFRGYVIDFVEIETPFRTVEFQFGFHPPGYVSEAEREIASHNTRVAAEEIGGACRGPNGTVDRPSAAAPATGPSFSGGDRIGDSTPTSPPSGPSFPPPEVRARTRRIHSFLTAVGDLPGIRTVGKPFGEGHGLEAVLDLIPEHFLDAIDVRECNRMVGVDLLVGPGETFQPDDLDAVMGVTDESLRRYGVASDQRKAITALAGAARTFLGQFEQEGANMWELWSRRDDVAAEFLSWHSVARLRLAIAGKMEAV